MGGGGSIHPLFVEDLINVLENLHENPNSPTVTIVNDLAKIISNRLIKPDISLGIVNTLRALKAFCGINVNEISAFQSIFSEIGKNYLKYNEEQKIDIIKSLGKRSFCNREVFKAVSYDIVATGKTHENCIEVLSALCQVNLEQEDYGKKIFNELTALMISEPKALLENLIIKLAFGLAKNNASKETIEMVMKKNQSFE